MENQMRRALQAVSFEPNFTQHASTNFEGTTPARKFRNVSVIAAELHSSLYCLSVELGICAIRRDLDSSASRPEEKEKRFLNTNRKI
jgi:hypothetical protein